MAGATRPNWRPKPPRPTLRRNSGSMHELLFVMAPGWETGFANAIDLGVPAAPFDGAGDLTFFSPQRAFWEATVVDGNYPKTPPNGIGQEGRGIKGFAETDRYRLANSINPGSGVAWRYQSFEIFYGWSCAVLYRPISVKSNILNMLATRRVSPFGAANSGWSIGVSAAGGYRASISDGATEVNANSTTLQSIRKTDLIVATYDRANLDLYVNGQREARVAGTIAVGNPNRSIRLFDTVTGNSFSHGVIGLVANWARPLSPGEVNQLYVDPFHLLREAEAPEGDSDRLYQTYFTIF